MPATKPESSSEAGKPDGRPAFRSHVWPRTRAGRAAVVAFLALFALVQPPLVFELANRVRPWVFGLPFLYAYLLAVYVALIGVLLWAARRRL